MNNNCCGTFIIDFDEGNKDFSVELGEIQGVSVPSYEGDYEVTPTASGFIMPTKNKRMEDDVTVKPIPYYETSNVSGITVYIAGQVEIGD